ncbi:MAG TPA: bacillithiol biosynthesis deacetylase BshB1 [Vicinamibacterales bacterium]
MVALDAVDPVDVLAFGPHPDDIEIGVGGVVAKHVALRHRVGLCDLSAGEMGSNGTVDERLAEAEAARGVLGAAWRVNLRLPDRAIGREAEHVRVVASLVRRARPRVVVAPYWSDRHPDHVSSSQLVSEAVFSAGLRRFPVDGEAWKAGRLCYYFINDSTTPSFVVDVSAHYDAKRRALACHVTQFSPSSADAVATRLTSARFHQLIESRDAQFGAQVGVAYAEGLVVRHPVLASHLLEGGAG